jgi:hypothetical protein
MLFNRPMHSRLAESSRVPDEHHSDAAAPRNLKQGAKKQDKARPPWGGPTKPHAREGRFEKADRDAIRNKRAATPQRQGARAGDLPADALSSPTISVVLA